MALTVSHHNEFSLDGYLHHVQKTLGCGINAAVREMERRIATGRLLLICQEYDAGGNPKGKAFAVNPRTFSTNHNLKFDTSDRLRVVPRTFRSMFGSIKFDTSDPAWSVVNQIGGLPERMDGFCFTVVEQDISALKPRPPASQTAPPQQLEDEAGPKASRPESGAKPSRISSSAIARNSAIDDLLDEGAHPGAGGTVQWDNFCHDVRRRADGFDGDPKDEKYKRGFSDEHIKRVTRRKVKLRGI